MEAREKAKSSSGTSEEIRQQINRIVKTLIDRHKGTYADLKKELLALELRLFRIVFITMIILMKSTGGKMKIRIEITPPRIGYKTTVSIWNVQNIDDFITRFIKDDLLIIGEPITDRWDFQKDEVPNNFGIRIPVFNLIKHSESVVTFETEYPETDVICIVFALDEIGGIHNIKVSKIGDMQDPLNVSEEVKREWDDLLVEAALSLEQRKNKGD